MQIPGMNWLGIYVHIWKMNLIRVRLRLIFSNFQPSILIVLFGIFWVDLLRKRSILLPTSHNEYPTNYHINTYKNLLVYQRPPF